MAHIDDVLTSLEQQVNDFSIALDKDSPGRKRSTSNVNVQAKRAGDSEDDDDDDHVLGSLLQQQPQLLSGTSHGGKVTSKSLGLARSLSAGANRFPRRLIPAEPVPALPSLAPTMPPAPNNDAEHENELQQNIQLALAALEGPRSPTKTMMPPSPDPASLLDPALEVRGDMIVTRIYLQTDGSAFKTVQLTLQFTAAMVIKYLRRKELLDASEDWALFEVNQRLGIERPLRQWESVAAQITCWEDKQHVLMVKKYNYAASLSPQVVRERPVHMQGWLTIEYKKGKWQRRYCVIRDLAIYHARDDSPSANLSVLCFMQGFDVYMVTDGYASAPTPHVLCLRGQDRASKYDTQEDYIRYISTDTNASLEQWILAIRHAKSLIQYQLTPKLVMYPLGVPDKETSVAQTQQQAQQQPARRLNRATSQENMRRKPSTRHGASGSGSRGGGGGGSGVPAPAPPMPAMHAQAPPTPQTLIQLEDRRPFAKGSLLDAATSSSNDILPSAASLTRSKSAVTRRKPSTTHPQHDVPLPNTQPIMVSANGPSTLLQLDNTRERHHTKTLLQRQMKPLLNFDSKAP